MAVRTSEAEWRGDLRQGKGTVRLGSGAFARVHLEREGEGFAITRIELVTEGQVPGLSKVDFQSQAESATKNGPVSKALAGPAISLTATLVA
jgi:osmotically inducible protein OsmC